LVPDISEGKPSLPKPQPFFLKKKQRKTNKQLRAKEREVKRKGQLSKKIG